jgi:flagellar hook protein FlgE
MGWQTENSTGKPTILKDTVSPLRVMRAENLTSAPEATTQANFSGVVDKNEKQVRSSNGYIRSFTFYDNLGYSYTAKFSIKLTDEINNEFSIELTNVYDSQNNDILNKYTDGDDALLSNVFGTTLPGSKDFDAISSNYTFTGNIGDQGGQITMTDSSTNTVYTFDRTTNTFVSGAETLSLAAVCGVPSNANITGVSVADNNTLTIETQSVGHILKFDSSEGTLSYAGAPGATTITMNTSLLGPNTADAALSDIVIDFANLLNYDNGGTSTAVANRGATDGTTGTGKKLGTMTGLSVTNNGEIYGSYSNGNTVLLGQIPVAQFANASGLEELGNNCYQTTMNSGEFDGIGLEVSADGSSMNTGQLEMANVDLSAEFTDMITTQRGFQANSRIITVSDTMLEELINLKR